MKIPKTINGIWHHFNMVTDEVFENKVDESSILIRKSKNEYNEPFWYVIWVTENASGPLFAGYNARFEEKDLALKATIKWLKSHKKV